jgi:hypothetical protein
MKVKELIVELLELDMDTEVYLSSDEEGNKFNLLNTIQSNIVLEDEDEDEDGYRIGILTVVLWP